MQELSEQQRNQAQSGLHIYCCAEDSGQRISAGGGRGQWEWRLVGGDEWNEWAHSNDDSDRTRTGLGQDFKEFREWNNANKLHSAMYLKDLWCQVAKDTDTISGMSILWIINEPTTAITYGLNKNVTGERNILIFDLS
ncbi:hypothetical protein B0H10DRAFT_1964784 [Mycena sp. CBHHK59/15]|nr:hypothetical protein B0H10DRAFT_1964784 [Mycena sp. CBHHK59/15]